MQYQKKITYSYSFLQTTKTLVASKFRPIHEGMDLNLLA